MAMPPDRTGPDRPSRGRFRRSVLEAGSALLAGAVAGCIADDEPAPTTPVTTDRLRESTDKEASGTGTPGTTVRETTGTPSIPRDLEIRITGLRVERMIATFLASTHVVVRGSSNHQFLVVGLAIEDDRLENEAVAVRNGLRCSIDGNSFGVAPDRIPEFRVDPPSTFELPFRVPLETAAVSGRVRWATDDAVILDRPLPSRTLSALRNPPEFVVQSFRVPPEVREERDVVAAIDVENVGDGDGRFLAELGSTVFSDQPEIEAVVPAGRRATIHEPVRLASGVRGACHPEQTVVLDWGIDEQTRSIRFPNCEKGDGGH